MMTDRRDNDAPEKLIVPFYMVIDESGSMEEEVPELNRGMVSMIDQVSLDPFAAALARITVIGFSDTASCYLDLQQVTDVETAPIFSVRTGGTSYAAAFQDLLIRIPQDVEALSANQYGVLRPSVFFLTDGQPTDRPASQWRNPLAELKAPEFKYRPNVLAFGIGDGVEAQTILDVASSDRYAWKQSAGTSVGDAIAEFWKNLTQSIVASASAAGSAGGGQQATVPIENPDGFDLVIDQII